MMRALVLCAALAAAGCVGEPVEPAAKPTPPTPEPVEPDQVPDAGPRFNVTPLSGSVAGVGNPSAGYLRASGENVLAFDVPEGATALLVEVAWAGGHALDVQVDVPDEFCEPVDPAGLFLDCPSPPPDADGASPARIEVTDLETLARAGEWRLGAWARSSASEVPFTAFVTVFADGKPDATYTALPPG